MEKNKLTLKEIFSRIDYRRILPNAGSREEANDLIESLYPNERNFIAFELRGKKFADRRLVEFLIEVASSKERPRKSLTRRRIPPQTKHI